MALALSHGERQGKNDQASHGRRRYSVVSVPSAGQRISKMIDAEVFEVTENTSLHHHNSRVCQEGICSVGTKREIERHPDSITCFDAVSLCLRLPLVLLRSISALRAAGPWHNELEIIYGPLFTSPSDELFNMILALRSFPHFEPTGLIEQLESRKSHASAGRKPEPGRTAPNGQAYECPSEHCRKQFKKSGHAQNHVDKHHPEYLKLHPDYQPSQFIVDTLRSLSGSPELQRAHERQPVQQHSPPAQQPISVASRDLLFLLSEPLEQPLLLSPRSFDLSSVDDWDEQPQLSRSRSHSRPSLRQPGTSQAPDAEVLDLDRCPAVCSLAPCVGTPQAKRTRDPHSSMESMAARYNDSRPTTTTTRPQRRHSKRRSTHGSRW